MKRFHIAAGLLLGSVLVAPVGLRADDERKTTTTTTTTTETQRYFDPVEKDYHEWNDTEDRSYRMYLREHHRDYIEFQKTKPREQKEYFKWRHGHPDSVTIKEKN